jgi:hypothetical protein
MKAKFSFLCLLNFLLIVKSQEAYQKNQSQEYRTDYGVLGYASIIDELANLASGIELKESECKNDLLTFKKGVEKSEVWAFKGK